jgi:hypothetical protein
MSHGFVFFAVHWSVVDEDGGGTLDIEECATMMQKIAQNFKGVDFDPPFSLGD